MPGPPTEGLPIAVRIKLEELRRLAIDAGRGAGLSPDQAVVLARHLLWYDAAGARGLGIRRLPGWLEALSAGTVQAGWGQVISEFSGAAVYDAEAALPPLVFARVGELVSAKARETGAAVVRVVGLSGADLATADLASELAVGPLVATVYRVDGVSWAIPASEGPPFVYDPALGREGIDAPAAELTAPWVPLVGSGEVVVIATAVAAVGPLERIGARVDEMTASGEAPPWMQAEQAAALRREVLEHGVPVEDALAEELKRLASRTSS